MIRLWISLFLFFSSWAFALQMPMDQTLLQKKTQNFLSVTYKSMTLVNLRIFSCQGITNEHGQFGSCYYSFEAAPGLAFNTYVYLFGQDGREAFYPIGQVNLFEPFPR